MHIPILAVGLIIVFNALLGAAIFFRTYKKSFGIFISATFLFIVLWSIGDILLLTARDPALVDIGAKVFYSAPAIVAVCIFFFALTFPENKSIEKKYLLPGLFAAVLWTAISFFKLDFIVESIVINTGLNTVTPTKLGFTLYSLHFSVFFFATYWVLLKKLKRHKDSFARSQIIYTLVGVGLASFLAMISNLMLPVFGVKEIIWLGPILTSFYVGFISYAIVKHRLFDIKLVVARSLAYLLTLGVITLAYSIVTSLLITGLLSDSASTQAFIALNAVFLAVSVLLYQPLKRFFDRVTNKIFYRDAYDPQEFMDELNKSIVSNIEIGILIRHTTAVIESNLKADFVQIAVREEGDGLRVAGTSPSAYTTSELELIKKVSSQNHSRIIISDDLSPSQERLSETLRKHNIAIICRLTAAYYGEEQGVAYLILGNKKSGNVYNKDDLRILEIISDELVIAIQNALRFEEIQDFNVTLQKKVNDATGKLKRTNDKLKALDETKDEFISMASHQLRTPLTSVKGYLSMVLEGDAGNVTDAQRKLLDQAFVSSQRMVYLIADLLNVSRLKTGKFIIDAFPTNLSEVVEGEITQLTEQAKLKNMTLEYKKPKSFPDLMLDETKIRQVIMNFVDNALYYTPSGGKIVVEVKEDKSHVYFTVKDNGLGVPKEDQKHLFMKFYRAKNARKARPDGTGLGLFMAKKVVTAQGGNILFESQEGKGSLFGFSFRKKHLEVAEK